MWRHWLRSADSPSGRCFIGEWLVYKKDLAQESSLLYSLQIEVLGDPPYQGKEAMKPTPNV